MAKLRGAPVEFIRSNVDNTYTRVGNVVQVDSITIADPLPAGNNHIGSVDIDNDIVTGFDHGAKSGIGVVAVQLTANSVATKRGVIIKASNTNTGIVYVGNVDVTNGTTDATDGFELGAGESVTIPVNSANLIYVIGSAAGQRVSWVLA